jgi:hypothetical protein
VLHSSIGKNGKKKKTSIGKQQRSFEVELKKILQRNFAKRN